MEEDRNQIFGTFILTNTDYLSEGSAAVYHFGWLLSLLSPVYIILLQINFGIVEKFLDRQVFLFYNIFCFVWVQRSLVACLNGVQEVAGSIPVTQTINFPVSLVVTGFIYVYKYLVIFKIQLKTGSVIDGYLHGYLQIQ